MSLFENIWSFARAQLAMTIVVTVYWIITMWALFYIGYSPAKKPLVFPFFPLQFGLFFFIKAKLGGKKLQIVDPRVEIFLSGSFKTVCSSFFIDAVLIGALCLGPAIGLIGVSVPLEYIPYPELHSQNMSSPTFYQRINYFADNLPYFMSIGFIMSALLWSLSYFFSKRNFVVFILLWLLLVSFVYAMLM